MKPFAHRAAGTKQRNHSRRSGHPLHGAAAPSPRRKKRAVLLLASLVGVVGSGAIFMDMPAPSSQANPVSEYAETSAISALQDGAEIYQARCLSCHQGNGGGVPGVFPPLTGTEWVTGDEEVLIRIVLNGMTGEIEVNGMTYGGVMPPWGAFLSDDEVAALLTYIRTEWNNDASEVAPETVAAVREAVGDRTEPWTGAELEAIREVNAEAAQAKAAEKTTGKTPEKTTAETTAEEQGTK